MRPIGTRPTRPLGTIAIGLVLASATATAQAQTAVTRQITSEPVETVVTQGPNGTAVTRRILSPEPDSSVYAPPPVAYGPVATEAIEPQYMEPAAPAVTTRRVTTNRTATTTAPARTRTVTSRQAGTRPACTESRTVTRTVVAPPPDQPLLLSPAQRQVIYRTVVQRELYPAPVPYGPPVVQTEVYPPPPPFGYPVRTVYPADEGDGDYAYDPYHDQYVREPYRPAYRQDGVPFAVGARIPQSVPLVAVPEPLAARIPAAAPYSYAVLDNRVYLVDPATSLIVAEITP
jgi:hypothetical protein